ncbi:FMN reductase [Phytoactinopolyspora limicola]|uniref:FMN reductase n=1 Tax=Phytoactinopolyspora limicola TaxID=2715536 RepID=UPI00140B409D|nr:FMN reductase [Phytoactinopolyspora limicola]
MTVRQLAVVSAGLSQPSSTRLLADRLTGTTQEILREHGDESEVTVIELRELAVDIAKHLVTQVPSPALSTAVGSLARADALIAVTPVFTASYSGLFKSFFDGLGRDDLAGLPVLLGATGGTERHSLVLDHHLRPMFAYLRALTVPTGVYAASTDWGPGREQEGGLQQRVHRAADELATLVTGRALPRASRDPLTVDVPFEQLLNGQ